jgi:hypothetical protein
MPVSQGDGSHSGYAGNPCLLPSRFFSSLSIEHSTSISSSPAASPVAVATDGVSSDDAGVLAVQQQIRDMLAKCKAEESGQAVLAELPARDGSTRPRLAETDATDGVSSDDAALLAMRQHYRDILDACKAESGQAVPPELPMFDKSTGPRLAETDAELEEIMRDMHEIQAVAALAIDPSTCYDGPWGALSGTAQPLATAAGPRPPAGLEEWEAMFEQQPGQVQELHHSRRRYCYGGAQPEAASSDSDTSDNREADWLAGRAARIRAAREPQCEGAVPAAAAADAMDLQEIGRASTGSSVGDYRDGGFGLPAPEEEEHMPAGDKHLQHSSTARKGLGRWWKHTVSRSFRKASVGLFGLPGSSNSSRKGLQLADSVPRRSHAAARASVDTVSTEDSGQSAGGDGGQPAPGRVGYLTKLFSFRSRRDVLLAAGDQ